MWGPPPKEVGPTSVSKSARTPFSTVCSRLRLGLTCLGTNLAGNTVEQHIESNHVDTLGDNHVYVAL